MNIINLTSHKVAVVTENETITFEPSGIEARCKEVNILVDRYNNIPVYETKYEEVMDLPEEKPDTIYIVSTLVRLACPDRTDLVSPAKPIRDTEGKIIGAMGFNK